MGNDARKYTRVTIRRLDMLSGNQCATPNCGKRLIAKDEISIISKICHIEAASKEGARYNPSMTDKERAHFNNLILLCDECHTIIDNKANEGKYTVSLLKEWKKNHESIYLQEQLRNTSLLTQAINGIADADFDILNIDDNRLQSFDISGKIKYNNVKRNKSLFEEFSGYYGKINSLYGELEEQGNGFKKEKLLRNIRTLYLKIKGRYIEGAPDPMIIIQEKADDILEDVESELLSLIKNRDGDNIFAISIVMVDAFMRCKILEEPIK